MVASTSQFAILLGSKGVNAMAAGFVVIAKNPLALFSLKIHRGDGMALLGMNWKRGQPPADFVGFAIEYQVPGSTRLIAIQNRLNFLSSTGEIDLTPNSSLKAPIQMFRWIHFPPDAEKAGEFVYRVTPVFMNADDTLRYGEPQQAALELRRETYPGQLNVAYTRGFVSSQAFVDRYAINDSLASLLPETADTGLGFVPTHPKAAAALRWMGFEAYNLILTTLQQAVADPKAQVSVVAYDLNEPTIVEQLELLGDRLHIIIDDDGAHGKADSAETQATARLARSAGAAQVKRQHMGKLQHNKFIVVDSPSLRVAICGSTNFSWRGLFVQSNNAIALYGTAAVTAFRNAFNAYWLHDTVAAFSATAAAQMIPVRCGRIDLQLGFAPFDSTNAMLNQIANDIENNTTSNLFFSLAFLYAAKGRLLHAINQYLCLWCFR
jgi:PLD-like domain